MNVRKRLKNFGYLILWMLLGIFIGGWLAYTTVLLWGDQQLASAYIAIGTLILASATVLLAFFSWRSIKSGYDKEKRDRRERRLNEIIAWATQVLECGRALALTGQYPSLREKLATFEFDLDIAVQSAFNVLSWRAVHIGFLAQHSIGDKDLNNAVENTRALVREQSELLSLSIDHKLKDNADIGRHRKKVDDSAKKVIELAVKLL
jgi:hypothetical protein